MNSYITTKHFNKSAVLDPSWNASLDYLSPPVTVVNHQHLVRTYRVVGGLFPVADYPSDCGFISWCSPCFAVCPYVILYGMPLTDTRFHLQPNTVVLLLPYHSHYWEAETSGRS